MMRAWFMAVTLTLGVAMPGLAQGPPASAVNVDAEGVALHGHDPVAYFTDGKAVPGAARFEHQWNGARWRFTSAANRDTFAKAPEKYAPQFGGSCAMNMASGTRRDSDPTIWVISNGQLYVFAGTGGAERFRQEAQTNAVNAAANWKTLKDTPSQ